MKISIALLLAVFVQVHATVYSQGGKRIRIEETNISLENLLWKIQSETDFVFVYSPEDVSTYSSIDLNLEGDIDEILKYVLDKTNLTFEKKHEVYVLKQKEVEVVNRQQSGKRTITGTVKDSYGEVIPGVNVYTRDGSSGSITDTDGNYKIVVPAESKILIFSFIGMVTQEIEINDQNVIHVSLEDEISQLDDVVVTGFFERNKSTFTGAAKTVSGEQLIEISTTNLFEGLAVLDPAIEIVQDNIEGSNPNNIPELLIRGTASLNASNEAGMNSPLIVIDGVESSLRDMYDMDIFDIESVAILKDASATALYGEQAANGVILVTRKRDSQKEVKLTYNFNGNLQWADLTEYRLMNARQKLDLERLYGFYDSNTGAKDELYNEKLARVNSGIDTDWLAKPLRVGFSQNHSARVSGRGSGLSYSISGRYGDTRGVMKDDYRRNYGLNGRFSYNMNQKLMITFQGSYSQTNSNTSKYGSFSDYAKANPYDAPYDEYGNLLKELSFGGRNPLYEASLSSFNESVGKSLMGSLDIRWNIRKGLYVTSNANISTSDSRRDRYISPDSKTFDDSNDGIKGSYSINASNNVNYLWRTGINCSLNLDTEGSIVTLNAGGELRKREEDPYGFSGVGFYSDRLNYPAFAAQYPEGGRPSGEGSTVTSIGAYGAGSVSFRQRYFVDGSYRLSGASNFGKNKRYAPFWSTGIGWNLHNESWLNSGWMDLLRLRASYGHTGSIAFSPHQAVTTYQYTSSLIYLSGNGANPITMGNRDLKWQTTKAWNFGLTSTFLKNRLNVNVDVYRNKTVDMIIPISMPPSTGVTQVMHNLGEQENKGYEVSISGTIIKNENLNWRLSANTSENTTTLVSIGDVLKNSNRQNVEDIIEDEDEDIPDYVSGSPVTLYREGESPTMIYAVRSAGIDPASGREIYITRDGEYTFKYNNDDRVAIADRKPDFRGSIGSYIRWKNFSLNVSAQYSIGGYIYNTTRANKVERINIDSNADERAYTERWHEPGDVVPYLSVAKTSLIYYHTDRYVEKENFLDISSINLSYEMSAKALKNIGFKRLRFTAGMNNIWRFSTVKQERGTGYPFARGFNFTISPTF